MACLKALPNELLHKIVDILVKKGLHGTAVSLARTDKVLESSVRPRIYRSVIENETFFLAHWAAEHGHVAILKRVIEAGADNNEPWTSCISPYEISKLGAKQDYTRLQAANLDCKELQQATQKRCSLMTRHSLDAEQWYRGKDNGYEEVDKDQLFSLWEYYSDVCEQGNRTGPIGQFAEELETKRIFLDAFAFWATPLHIAIREGKDEIVEVLIETKKLGLNSSTYGNCRCDLICASQYNGCAFSALHQALCEAKGVYAPQLIRLGMSYLTITKRMLDATVGTLLVRPVLATVQPRNLLHETLSGRSPLDWNHPLEWCKEQHRCGNLRECVVDLLLDNGYESRLNERDENNQLAIEIACTIQADQAIISTLLERGISQYDRLSSVTFKLDNLNTYVIGNILTWAIARNELRLAESLLTREIMEPLFDISAPSLVSGYTALHVLCMRPQGPDEDASGLLRNQILRTILTKTEADTVSSGHTPLTYALNWLVDSPRPNTTPLRLVSTLLCHGADILNENQEDSQTPLEIFLEHIANRRSYIKALQNKRSVLYRHDKESLWLQAIRRIRLDKYIADRTDAIDCIARMLRKPVNLSWVPQALEQLRSVRSARLHQ